MADLSQRQKLEQGRAAFAFTKAVDGYNAHRAEYAPVVRKVPMMIKTNGLGAALAFMYSKGKVLGTILQHVEAWVQSTDNLKTHLIMKEAAGSNFVERIMNLNSQEYRIVTIEVLAFLMWLSRFSDGIVKEREAEKKKEKQQ